MNLKYLQYFVEIVKRQSFSKAADDIYITQSALSKAVKRLEQDLNAVLIDRTNKQFKLTNEGEIVMREGEILLQYIEESKQELFRKVHRSRGKIKVGIPPVISTAYFSYLIYQIREKYTDMELEVIEAGAQIVQSMVDNGEIDIGVVILPIYSPDKYQIFPAMSSENVLIVNKNHPLADRTEVAFRELRDENFLILNNTYMLHEKIITNCETAGFYPNITTQSSQWDFLAEMVALNQGISILPKPIVKKFSSGEKIRIIHLKDPHFPWNIAMLVKKEKLVTEQMIQFISYVTEHTDYMNEIIN